MMLQHQIEFDKSRLSNLQFKITSNYQGSICIKMFFLKFIQPITSSVKFHTKYGGAVD